MSSISTAASALRSHQSYMDVVANNIANMNTIGYKTSSVLFQDMLNRTFSKGSAPNANLGGRNPVQIGLGMQLGGISSNMAQGSLQSTGRAQDLAITGSGFFVYAGPQQNIYSRDGALGMDAEGNLVNLSTGMQIQGWMANDDGVVDRAAPIEDVQIPIGAPMAAVATQNVQMGGNLDASAEVDHSTSTSVQFYDSLGVVHPMDVRFTKTGNNDWAMTLQSDDDTVTLSAPTPDALQFDNNGNLLTPADGAVTFEVALNNGSANQEITLNLSNLSQVDSPDNERLYVTNQDGRAPGEMIDFNIDNAGKVVAIYSNGLLKTLGQLAVAEFVNPAGLVKTGQNGYVASGNSGEAQVVAAGERSQISAGFLEMSNVDLTLEFSEMIRAQRGFQANSRVVTSSDEMIQELVNLVR